MSESPLEAIRRQIRQAEARLKESSSEHEKAKPPLADLLEPKNQERQDTEPPAKPAEVPDPGLSEVDSGSPGETVPAAHERLRAFFESAKEAFILVDSKGQWELENHHLPGWLGYTREEFQKVTLTDVFETEDVRRLLSTLPQWISGDTPIHQAPFSLKGKREERVPVLLSTHAWTADKGERVAYLVLEDMRVRRTLESQIAGAKGFLDALMRGGTVPIFLLRRDGLIMDANHAACVRLGVGIENLLNTRLRDFVAPEERDQFEELMERALSQPSAVDARCRIRRAGGDAFAARVLLAGVPDSKGNIHRVLGTMEEQDPVRFGSRSESNWCAYGRMTEGLAGEVAAFVASSICDAFEMVPPDDVIWTERPALARLLHDIEQVRSVLTSWSASGDLLGGRGIERKYGEMLREAVASRKVELERSDIQVSCAPLEAQVDELPCSSAFLPAVLHILQSCINNRQGKPGSGHLTIRTQAREKRLESSFSLQVNGCQPSFETTEFQNGRPPDLELQAASRIMDALGGALVIDYQNDCRFAIHMRLGLHVPAGESATSVESAPGR